MIFISLNKFKGKPTREMLAQSEKLMKQAKREGAKLLGLYWTLGRYDSVAMLDAKDEKIAMRALLRWGDMLSSETLVALPREEAVKLVK